MSASEGRALMAKGTPISRQQSEARSPSEPSILQRGRGAKSEVAPGTHSARPAAALQRSSTAPDEVPLQQAASARRAADADASSAMRPVPYAPHMGQGAAAPVLEDSGTSGPSLPSGSLSMSRFAQEAPQQQQQQQQQQVDRRRLAAHTEITGVDLSHSQAGSVHPPRILAWVDLQHGICNMPRKRHIQQIVALLLPPACGCASKWTWRLSCMAQKQRVLALNRAVH
jgi:hypothetical protein